MVLTTLDMYLHAAPHRMLRLLVILAALGIQAVVIGVLFTRYRTTITRSVREAWTDVGAAFRTEPSAALIALAAMTMIGLVTRAAYLSSPLRGDEAGSYIEFVKASWWVAWSNYRVPNNHVLHTLLAKAATLLFGDALWSLRLPAFLAGILLIPATYLAARARYSTGAALAATALATAAAPLVIYSVNARGYTLLCLAFLLSIAIGAYALRTGNVVAWGAYAVANAIGFFTIPTMLYPFGAMALWLAASARRQRDFIAITLASLAALVLTADCYAGVAIDRGYRALVNHPYTVRTAPAEFWSGTRVLLSQIAHDTFDGMPRLAIGIVVLAVAIALIASPRLTRWRLPLFVPIVVWSAALYVAMHVLTFSRVFIFATLEMLITAGAGLAGWPRLAIRWTSAASVAAALALAVAFARSDAMAHSLEFVDAQAIARTVGPDLRPGDQMETTWFGTGVLRYYLVRSGFDTVPINAHWALARRTIVIAPRAGGPRLAHSLLAADSLDSVALPSPTLFSETAVYIVPSPR